MITCEIGRRSERSVGAPRLAHARPDGSDGATVQQIQSNAGAYRASVQGVGTQVARNQPEVARQRDALAKQSLRPGSFPMWFAIWLKGARRGVTHRNGARVRRIALRIGFSDR